MGFHVCAYCSGPPRETSSGHVLLRMSSGRLWEVPDMLLHYVADHYYRPPAEFINDIMDAEVVAGGRLQTKGRLDPTAPEEQATKIGYLEGPIQSRWSPEHEGTNIHGEFFMRLWRAMRLATHSGARQQTRAARTSG